MVSVDTEKLYLMIEEGNISTELMSALDIAMPEIIQQEKECLKLHRRLKEFLYRDKTRVGLLAKKIGITQKQVLKMRDAVGSNRFIMMKHGVFKIREAINELNHAEYKYESLNRALRMVFTAEVKRWNYTITQIQRIAEKLKEHANCGNHDVSMVLQQKTHNKYAILSMGFDLHQNKMYKSHICDRKNPHVHATRLALMNIPETISPNTDLTLFSQTAPCPTCAKNILKTQVKKVICVFHPEEMEGLDILCDSNIGVHQIKYGTSKFELINEKPVLGNVA